jgi:hypothetical protein
VKEMALQKKRKKSTSPPTYEGWNTLPPQPMKMDFLPLNFLKQDKSPPEAVLKNHSTLQKNHKMEISIVLISKRVHLHYEHII